MVIVGERTDVETIALGNAVRESGRLSRTDGLVEALALTG